MHERIVLKSVKPDKIAPSFMEWLSQAGKVEFDECLPMSGQYRMGIVGERSGVIVQVNLNGRKVGELECCINPSVVWYNGLRPLSLSIPVKKRWMKQQQEVLLGYSWESPVEGVRLDTWHIPFP